MRQRQRHTQREIERDRDRETEERRAAADREGGFVDSATAELPSIDIGPHCLAAAAVPREPSRVARQQPKKKNSKQKEVIDS
jgi:hypothetical protein